jgi:hypothetical protein
MMFIYVIAVYVSSDPGTYIVRIRFAFPKPGVTVAESVTLLSAALDKAFFAECPTKDTRQRDRYSAKPRIPVVTFGSVTLWIGGR